MPAQTQLILPQLCLPAIAVWSIVLWSVVLPVNGQIDETPLDSVVPPIAIPRSELNAERVQQLTVAIDEARGDRAAQSEWLGQRAKEYARAHDWRAAGADYQRQIDLNPNDTIAWLKRGTMLLLADDAMAHDDFARKMIAKFKDTKNVTYAERAAKMIWLSPSPGVDRAEVDPLADFAYRHKHDRWGHYFPTMKALGYVRYGEFEKALADVDESDRLIAAKGLTQPDVIATNEVLRAMCLAHLGKPADAERTLISAGAKIQAGMKGADLLWDDNFSHDWAIAAMLHAEARKLLAAKVKPE